MGRHPEENSSLAAESVDSQPHDLNSDPMSAISALSMSSWAGCLTFLIPQCAHPNNGDNIRLGQMKLPSL